MRNLVGPLAGVVLLLQTAVSWAGEVSIYSEYMSQVDDNIVLAGELDLKALKRAHEGTIRIVDLRTEAEGTPEEALAAGAMGIEYTNIPVSSALVDPEQVAALRAALDTAAADDLVVVHCRTGNRAGLLWGAVQLEDGVALAEVKAQVSGIVTAAPISEGLEAYAKQLDAGL